MINAAVEIMQLIAFCLIFLLLSLFVQDRQHFLTRTGVNVGQKLQVGPQPVEVGWISSPLQSNRQLLNTLSK